MSNSRFLIYCEDRNSYYMKTTPNKVTVWTDNKLDACSYIIYDADNRAEALKAHLIDNEYIQVVPETHTINE